MNNPASVAPSHPPPPQRPPYPPTNTSFRSDYGQPNGRPSPVNAPSPGVNFSSPSPQHQFSPQFGQPAAKRPRLSPDAAASPFSGSPYPQTPTGQARSPVSLNGSFPPQQPRAGSMAPPQRPPTTDVLDGQADNRGISGMGVNLEEEERNLSRMNWPSSASPHELYPPRTASFEANGSVSGQVPLNGPPSVPGDMNGTQIPELSAEEKKAREEQRLDWEASRHTQNPLWDHFLYGGTLNDRIRKISLQEHLTDPQHGVLVNTQKSGPPPIARVNGQEGATRVIDKGQAILDSHKGERLGEVMKLVALATKTRLTGIMSASARLAMERHAHSKGRVPTDWEDLAVMPSLSMLDSDMNGIVDGASSVNPLKRTHDQATSDTTSQRALSTDPENVAVSVMAKIISEEKAAEDARRAKRAKRKAAADAASQAAQTAAEEEAVAQAAEPKKPSKKQLQADKSKTQEAHQHQQANAAANMAMSSLLGGRKGKQYSWMTKGGSGASTPSRPGAGSALGTPKPAERPKPVVKEKKFGAWDEDKDPGVQVRDVLLVLETDGRASRAYTKGCVMLDS